MARNNLQVRTVIFREGDWWVAQCLEFDIATQAKTLKDLAYDLQRVLVGHMVVCRQEGITPFTNLPKAPEKYWEMFSEGLELSAPQNFKLQLDTDVSVPTPELHLVG
jgi:predicted RNase H-like HicB family nuclease